MGGCRDTENEPLNNWERLLAADSSSSSSNVVVCLSVVVFKLEKCLQNAC